MSSNPRVPSGVPTGGQFAAHSRAESSVTLDPRDRADRNDRQAAAGQARRDVDGEVAVMASRPDLGPDYNVTSPWRRTVLGRRRIEAVSGRDFASLDPDHARRCVDFCINQAVRFTRESRVAPDPADRPWMDGHEWRERVESHAYRTGLADSYAYWASAIEQGAEPSAEQIRAVRAEVVERVDYLLRPDRPVESPMRADLLASPELRGLPAPWLEDKSDQELREAIDGMRASRAAFEAEQAADADAAAAETARRRAYRRPEWLDKDGDTYTTEDGFRGTIVQDNLDGRTRTAYLVRGPQGQQTEVSRVEEMADWIEAQRSKTS